MSHNLKLVPRIRDRMLWQPCHYHIDRDLRTHCTFALASEFRRGVGIIPDPFFQGVFQQCFQQTEQIPPGAHLEGLVTP